MTVKAVRAVLQENVTILSVLRKQWSSVFEGSELSRTSMVILLLIKFVNSVVSRMPLISL